MYNEEIKERFLAELSAGRNEKSCRAKFKAIGLYEKLIGKDLAEMTIADAMKAMQYVKVGSYGTAFSLISQVRSYVKWCNAHNVFSLVNTDLVSLVVDDVDISADMRKMLFRTEEEFIKELRLARPFDDGYFDVVVMVFSWLGISQDQVLDVKINDVDFDSMVIHLHGKDIEFSNNLGEILNLYSKTKKGTRLNKNGPRDVYRDDSYDIFVRKFSAPTQLGKKLTKPQLQNALHDLNEIYIDLGNEPRFTSGNVLTSGALCRIFELERSGVDVFLMRNKDAVVKTFVAKAKLHEILWLYKNYKRAFSL